MSTSPQSGWWSGRTRLATIVSILAVGAAGAVAVGANIGVLDAASNSDVGTLSAAGDLTSATSTTQVVDVYLGDVVATTATTPITVDAAALAPATVDASGTDTAGSQSFTVDAAGTVSVAAVPGGLRLDAATPTAGWNWSLAQSNPGQLTVTFTNGLRTLQFVAVAQADGTVSAGVTEPIAAPTPIVASGGSGGSDHEGEDDEHEGGGDDD